MQFVIFLKVEILSCRGEELTKTGYRIVLTADKTLFTDYGGFEGGGFLTCLPKRFIPNFFLYRVLCPKVPSKDGRALYAPYSLRKIEASLLANGFSQDEVVVTPPDELHRVIGEETRVVGITTVDPRGYAPVSHTLCSLFGGGKSCTTTEFEKLLRNETLEKHRNHLQIVVGGPGVWQISQEDAKSLGINTVFVGECEESIVEAFRRAVGGERLPPILRGGQSHADRIPEIVNPVRCGHVQITRGCGRGCQFCTPTMRRWISFPKQTILNEVKVNLRGNIHHASFITDDGLRYGSRGIETNREAVLDLYKSTLAIEGIDSVSIAHASFPTVVQAPDLIHNLSELCGYTMKKPFIGPQIGLETGSPRLIKKYMIGKPRPYKPEEWPEIVAQATGILNDNYWYPCTTLVIGLPEENEDDVSKTIELIEELKGSKQWLFPLFFVAMGGSMLEKEKTFTLNKMTQAHWDLLFECWEHSLKFSKEIVDRLFTSGNTLTRKITRAFVKKGISIAEKYLAEIRKNPEKLMETLKDTKIESVKDFIKATL